MKYLTLTLTTLILFTNAAYASTAKVDVNGLVCDFCARALEKVFGKQDAVENINVDLDKKIVTINFKEGQNLDDETLTKLITDSGYAVEKIRREEAKQDE